MNAHKSNFLSLISRTGIALGIIGMLMSLMGCAGTCCVITRLDLEPQWVCPGKDFSPNVHFRLENFDEDGDPSSDGTCLWSLWETTKAKPNQPGAVNLTQKVGPLANTGKGRWETPATGVHVVAGAQATGYRISLIASNPECNKEGEEYLKNHQAEIEKLFGVDLDDNEVMTAHAKVELISARVPGKPLCVPHALDVQSGFTWVKDEVRAGKGIAIEGVENLNPFSLEVKHVLPPPLGPEYAVLQPKGKPGAGTTVFDGRSPNGKWFIKAVHSIDYDNYMKHGLKYLGKPSICIAVGLRCQ